MSSSGAGDKLGIQLQSNNQVGTDMRVSGWFDIKHTCSETGKVTDHSGPNALVESGLRAMLSACTVASVTNEVNITGKVGFAFSASPVTSFTKGQAVTCGTGAGNNLTTITTGIEANSAAESFDTTPGLLLDAGPEDVFTGSTITRSGAVATLITHNDVVLTLKATATTTINSIILGADGGTADTVTPIAVKTVDAGISAGDSRKMNQIVMNANDTLTLKYTLTVTAS